ncbi:kremen protein 2-like, partial [Cetorhinus maximus]
SVGACEGNVTGLSGVVYSPNFPDDYRADSNCTWSVRPEGAGSIQLDFQLFEVRDGNDRLELRDGHSQRLLASFDGQRHPPQRLIFHTDYLTVHFLSDQIVHAQGFALLFTGLRYNSSQAEEVRGTSFSQFQPTAADRLNSSYSTGKATTIAAWVMYTAAGVFAAVTIGILYHLRKRSCLYVPRKTTSGVLVIRRQRDRCRCPPVGAWSVVYKHTRVVVCRHSVAQDPPREYVCIGEGYNNLSGTNQSSLKSLISSS